MIGDKTNAARQSRQQYLFRKKGSTMWQGVTGFVQSPPSEDDYEYRALEFTKREVE